MKSNNRVLKVNLSDLSGREMSNREKMSLKGGDVGGDGKCCSCGCCYMGEPGGSSDNQNMYANWDIPTTTLCETNITCVVEHGSGGGIGGDKCSGPAVA